MNIERKRASVRDRKAVVKGNSKQKYCRGKLFRVHQPLLGHVEGLVHRSQLPLSWPVMACVPIFLSPAALFETGPGRRR